MTILKMQDLLMKELATTVAHHRDGAEEEEVEPPPQSPFLNKRDFQLPRIAKEVA